MTREAVERAVLEALAAVAPEADLASLDRDRPLREQVDLDSYDYLNLMLELATRLGVDIPERDYPGISALRQLVDYLVPRVREVPRT